jgi:hypothetical protein
MTSQPFIDSIRFRFILATSFKHPPPNPTEIPQWDGIVFDQEEIRALWHKPTPDLDGWMRAAATARPGAKRDTLIGDSGRKPVAQLGRPSLLPAYFAALRDGWPQAGPGQRPMSWRQSGVDAGQGTECLCARSLLVNRRSNLALTQFWCSSYSAPINLA